MPWIDADTVLAIIERNEGRPIAALPSRPLNYDDAAFLAGALGWKYEHQSDGTTLILVEP